VFAVISATTPERTGWAVMYPRRMPLLSTLLNESNLRGSCLSQWNLPDGFNADVPYDASPLSINFRFQCKIATCLLIFRAVIHKRVRVVLENKEIVLFREFQSA
jgi:hypothetical protein